MAKLSQFRVNSAAINSGEWVRVGDEYDDLEIRTKGFTDAYYDVQAIRQRKAAVGFGGDVSRLPNAIRRQINVDALINTVLLDVRNLFDDEGKPVTFDGFCDYLRNPDYLELVVACFRAAGQVGQQRQADVEEAAGPLAPPSASISNGDSSPTS